MKKNMFKNAISIVAAALLSMVATTAWSQTTTIPTNSMTGWSIDNESTFHINTWSGEGVHDGSGMTTPFLENWVTNGGGVNRLPAGVWSYTVTGLTANAVYEFSALVRANNEASNVFPSGVCTYAGDYSSEDISTGNEISYNGNSGYYKTLTVDGIADANGNLTVGVKVSANSCNWVAMKNATLTYIPSSSSSFVRVTGTGEITNGANYLIVYQTAENATYGYALDGSSTTVSQQYTSISNYTITSDAKYAFKITNNGTSYGILGVGNNLYLWPKDAALQYNPNVQTMSITSSGNGFYIGRTGSGNTKYVIYSGNQFSGSNKDDDKDKRELYLYKQVTLSFSEPEYTSYVGQSFTAPLTQSPSNIGITYTSSNTSVATVNSSTGAVTMNAVGTTVITATYQATKGSVSASYLLRVLPVSLSFPESEYSAKLDEGFSAPELTKTPSDIEVTYSSSNTSVATVNASTGAVTLKGTGSTTITAKAGSVSASYVLYVTASTSSIFTKVTDLSQVISDRDYLFVYENGTTGYVLDGTNSSSFSVTTETITDDVIQTDGKKAFTFTKNGTSFNIKQVGGGSYLCLAGNTQYSSSAQNISIASWFDEYFVFKSEDGYYLDYQNSNFAIKQYWPTQYFSSSASFCIYRKVQVAIDPNLTFVFTKGSDQVLIGGTLATTVTKNGYGTVTYSSSDEAIATVDANGVVTGVGAGTAVITASLAEDTENGYAAATKTLTVTVNKLTATVTANFSSKTIAVGDQTTLVLTTASTGTKRFQSSNTAFATVDANGVIKGIADGTATITYWVDENNTYNAIAGGSVSITVATTAKLTPEVTVNPSSLTLAIWEVKSLVVDLGDYDGECTATYPGEHGKIISLRDPEKEDNVLTYQITAEAVGEITITLHLEETANYNAMDIEVPVTVLSVYKYQLKVVNAPAKGVAIEIFGTTYTGTTTFNSSHHPIKASDVSVRSLASYTSSVTIDDESTITVTYALRYPEKGTFLRLKSYSGNKYATLAADGEALTMSTEGTDNIIYYDAKGRFLFYQNGQFVKATNKMAPVGGTSDASVFTFVHGDPSSNYSECYSVETATGKYLCGSSDGTSEGGSDDNNDYAYWYVETIEELPVEITTAGYGYATLFAPVALDLPGGVAAYYVSDKTVTDESGNSSVEYKLVLTSLVSLIPANTPTILIGMPGTTYTFPIKYSSTEAKPEDLSNMVGHLEAELTNDLQGSGTVYALQPTKEKETVGFYPWHQTVTSPFKCFFLDPNPNASAAGYRFVFANENSTDLNESLTEPVQDFAVFNILGQRVTESIENLPAGIYLIGGKKVIIK